MRFRRPGTLPVARAPVHVHRRSAYATTDDLSDEEEAKLRQALQRTGVSFEEMTRLHEQVYSNQPDVARVKLAPREARIGKSRSGSPSR